MWNLKRIVKKGINDSFARIRSGLIHSIKSLVIGSTCDPYIYIRAFWSRSGSHLIKRISHLYSQVTCGYFFFSFLSFAQEISIISSIKIFVNHNILLTCGFIDNTVITERKNREKRRRRRKKLFHKCGFSAKINSNGNKKRWTMRFVIVRGNRIWN